MFNFKFNFNFVPVASDFIETHMSTANGEYVKVYLYILNMAVKGLSTEPRIIARRLNLLESDVMNAVEYWQEKGLLSSNGGTITIGASITATEEPVSAVQSAPEQYTPSEIPVSASSQPAPVQTSAQPPDPIRTKKSAAQVSEKILSNPELADLTAMAHQVLNKPLTNDDIATLYWFNDSEGGLGFSPELIMILIEYCVNNGKVDMRYIEKTAIGWHKDGVKTIADAEKYLSSKEDMNKFYYELKKIFGIQGRNLSKAEEKYIYEWHNDCGMSAEMIALAYEYCIMATGKISFQYMDSIIKNWHKLNISTVDAAQKNRAEFRSKNPGKAPGSPQKKFSDKSASVYRQGATDYSDLEKRMNEKY